MRLMQALAVAGLGLGLSGCTDSDDGTPEVARATCDVLIGGAPWGDGPPVESRDDIDAELAAMDMNALPAMIDISALTGFELGFIAYALEVAPQELPRQLSRDDVLARGPMGKVVLGAMLKARESDGEQNFDLTFYRQGFHRYYSCTQEFPMTLDGFKEAVFDFTDRPATTVESIAKCGPRRIKADFDEGVFIAETMVDGVVRETEILLSEHRADGQLAFLAYDHAGNLTNRSEFPTTAHETKVVASPYGCMSCHFQASDVWSFDKLIPESGVCGVENQ